MDKRRNTTKVKEAIAAGNEALNSLTFAKEYLDNAKDFEIGGQLSAGRFATLLRKSKINLAVQHMDTAKEKLLKFKKELREIQIPSEIRVDFGSFLTFADFFFDGWIAYWMAQNKMQEVHNQLEDAICMVKTVQYDLKRMVTRIETGLERKVV